MTTLPSQMVSPRDRVIEKSRQVVLGYAAARDHWNPASSLSALLRQMQREYEGRFLYELIQNAYDAHPADAEGEIVVLLDLDEGDHGVLYVANSGRPFTDENFEAICELAQSDKTPDESIGNKGVGFKSVLQVCTWPEIYSAAEPGQKGFEGYCFTFARPDQYGDLAGGDPELAAQMSEDVAPYFLSVPLDDQPARVLEFAARGLATVIRLPIKSASAREVVVERVDRLVDEDVPVHLFLERLRSLEITRLDSAPETASRTLRRESIPIEDPANHPDQRYEYVDLGDHGEWFITSRRMAAEAMRAAISESIAEGQLDESWASWSHDAWVSVAVRTDGLEIQPRLYTFLPMEREASAPFHGHIHAPFSTMLARSTASEHVVLNAQLLDCAARASTAAVLAFRTNDDVLAEVALVDLLAWDGRHHDRVTQGFADAGTEMANLEVVPIEPLPDGRRRGTFQTTSVWRYPELTLLDQERLARDALAELVSSTIVGRRLERLEAYCQSFFHVGFLPNATLRADWIDSAAQELHGRRSRPRTWDRFYAELAQLFDQEADALRGHSILLGDDGRLYPSPPEDESEGHPLVFFPPAYERTDEDDEVEADVDLKPPAKLRRALILMSEELTWTRQEGRTRRRTPARKFLEDNKLVRRFKTVDLLEHVGRALAADGRAELSRDALRFAFSLFVATSSLRQRDLRALGLRVPTLGGWRPAAEAFFSPGWDTPLAVPLLELIERGSACSSGLAALEDVLLKDPADWPTPVENRDNLRAFLSDIGVRDGLWPQPVVHGEDPADGNDLQPQALARHFGLTSADAERWAQAVTGTPGWRPNYPYTPYRPRDAVSVLPGQADYEALDDRGRALYADLVVAGLESWPAGALEIAWYRFRHSSQPDERRWPSPIAAFLREAEWLPISDPGQRREESFVAPRDAWYFTEARGEEAPYFSPLLAGRLRRHTTAVALARLKDLELGDWGEARDAPRLLHHLAGLVENEALPETGLLAFRRAYEDAWSRAAELDVDEFAAKAGNLSVVVACAGELAVQRPSDGPDIRVYLLGEGGSLAARILEASDLPILSVESEQEPRIRPLLQAVLQDRLLTVDELEVDVVIDSGSFTPDGSGELLVGGELRWLDALIALVLETRRGRSGQMGPRRRREISDRLMRIRRVDTGLLELRVGGLAVEPPERHRRVVPLDDQRYPTLIVASDAQHHVSGLVDLITTARPLCELLGIAQYEDPILLALERLHAQGCQTPTDEDFARVLEIDPARVAEVRSHVGGSLNRMLRMLVPVVAYHALVPQALALFDVRDAIATEDDLRNAMEQVTPTIPDLDRALTASRDAESLSSIRDSLGLDYGRFNGALRALAPEYDPIHNEDGHRQAMAHYVQTNRSDLLQELRQLHVAAFREHAPLDAYVASRELDIPPDPDWLDLFDLPPEELLEARAREWMAEHGAPGDDDVASLPEIDHARAENRAVMTRVAEAAGELVPAWARKHRAPLPDIWTEDEPSQRAVSSAIERGLLDFELLATADALAWLHDRGWWPDAIGPTPVVRSA